MSPQAASTVFLIIPLILNTIYAPPQTREPPMASAPEPVVFQLSNHQRHDGLDSGPSASANHLSWLPPAGICSDHFGIANTTDSSSVLLLLVVSLPDRGDPHPRPPARHGHPGRNNTKVDVDRTAPWTSHPLEPGTCGAVPHLGSEPVHSADGFGLNFSLDVGLFSLSDSSSLFSAPPMTISERGGKIGAPVLFGLVLCSGDGNGSFTQSLFQDGRRYRNEVSRNRQSLSAAQPRKLLGGHSHTNNFHGRRRPRPALEPKTPAVQCDAAATIAICSALVALVCTVAGLVLWCTRNMLRGDETSIRLLPDDLCPAGPRRYSHRELAAATGGFPDEGMVGRGGFGPVYRGYLRDHGCHAAIKVLSSSSSVQAQGMREFQAEVKVMTRLRHRNIVQLLGWSGEAAGPMLVYEFLPNGSLDKHLHTPQGGPLLAWTDRYKIALGVGSAILYLHTECEQCVLHGDIKPANILLDASCNAKLADFGLARLVDHGTDDSRTTQVVAGTPGYMDPELVNNGRPSTEADVFSFGVVLLELACGRRPTAAAQPNAAPPVLLNWARGMYLKNTVLGAADRRLDGEFDQQQMRRVLVTGLWCTHHDQTQRPPIAQAMDLLRRRDAELPILPEMRSPATASVRSLEEIAFGDLDLSAEGSVFEDSTADTAYHTSQDSTCLLECLEENGT